jgi:hypothetical protein
MYITVCGVTLDVMHHFVRDIDSMPRETPFVGVFRTIHGGTVAGLCVHMCVKRRNPATNTDYLAIHPALFPHSSDLPTILKAAYNFAVSLGYDVCYNGLEDIPFRYRSKHVKVGVS